MLVEKITNSDFVNQHLDYEKYVLVHSSAFEAIYDEKMKDTNDSDELEGLVKISYNGKSIYRKSIGGHVKKDKIQMGYRTMHELKVSPDTEVRVTPANWFCYYWCNSDSNYKQPFRIAVVSLAITVLSIIISLCSLMQNCCCC